MCDVPTLSLMEVLPLDISRRKWDHPTMSTTTADSKKRVVIPTVKPGDVFDIQIQAEGRYLLVRLQRPDVVPKKSREECLRAMAESPLGLRLSWDQLRQLTRET